jgi:hypothetical protein
MGDYCLPETAPDPSLCPDTEPMVGGECDHPGLFCNYEFSDCDCTCMGWECGD